MPRGIYMAYKKLPSKWEIVSASSETTLAAVDVKLFVALAVVKPPFEILAHCPLLS